MTSNLGSEYIESAGIKKEYLVMSELRKTFKPEFINRIDEIAIFEALTENNMLLLYIKF